MLLLFFGKNAENSIRFYRNLGKTDDNQNLLDTEIAKMKSILANSDQTMKNNNWRTIEWSNFTTKPALKAILIGLVLVILNTSNGVIPIMTYITYLFKDIGSNLSANESGIIASAIQLISVGIATQLVDRLGRKVNKNLVLVFSFI